MISVFYLIYPNLCVRENCDVLNTSKIELIVARVTLKIGAEFPKKLSCKSIEGNRCEPKNGKLLIWYY